MVMIYAVWELTFFDLRRMLIASLVLFCYWQCRSITALLGNQEFSRIVSRVQYGLLGFAIAWLSAALIDSHIGTAWGVAAGLVHIGFWVWIGFYLRKQKQTLVRMDDHERGSVTGGVNIIIAAMRRKELEAEKLLHISGR